MDKLDEIKNELFTELKFIQVNNLEEYLNELSKITGIYCIKVADFKGNGFNDRIKEIFISRNNPILYIGISGTSTLKKRLLQELRGKGHGTFIRSIGASLGFLPLAGSLRNRKNKYNYKFSDSDSLAIIDWINSYLKVSWYDCSQDLKIYERKLIELYNPLLNITCNPNALQELIDLRKNCIEVANI